MDRIPAPLELTLECSQGDDLFVLPASYAQQRMWFLDRLYPGRAIYNIPSALRFEGAIDLEALRVALERLVARHESLRTVLDLRDGEVVQIVLPATRRELPLVDLSMLDSTARAAALAELLQSEGDRPFDLQAGPLLRSHAVRLATDEHVLLLTAHHAVSDAWSNGVFYRDLSALYTAATAGTAAELPPLPIQYGDYSIWQRERLQGEVLEDQLQYWRTRLHGPLPTLELPADRPRGPVETFSGGQEIAFIPAATLEAVKCFAQQENATPFMVLLAAYQILLHRYTGQPDIVVGCPIAGRSTAETEALIGLFVNTLALRTELAVGATFRQVVAQVRDAALGAFAHADVPFERIVEAIHPVRDRGHSPVFQVAFQLQNTPTPVLDFPGLRVTRVATPLRVAKFELTLSLRETNGGLRGAWEYNAGLFDGATIQRMAGHYATLLDGLLRQPATAVSRVPFLPAAERHTLLEEWNATRQPYRADTSIHALIGEQAARTPDATAVICGSDALTYGTLDLQADQLSRLLSARGIGSGSYVGICLDRTARLPVAMLGVLKSGAAYVPLDPAFPRERLAQIAEDAGLGLIVTDAASARALPHAERDPIPRLWLDAGRDTVDLRPATSAAADAATAAVPTAAAPAYVLYTSGSTGRPKGVTVSHANVVNFLESMRRSPGMDASDVLVAVTTISFDIAGLELFLPLSVGARVVIASRAQATDGAALAAELRRVGATVMQATPATWRLLIDADWRGAPGFRALCGGEALPQALAGALLERCAALWNLYGPTETTIWSAVDRVRAGESVSIGRPIANTRCYVLDAELEPVPIGVAGELYIGGAGVSLGYHLRPDLTAERFMDDPFAACASAPAPRLYRTGDRVRRWPDGRLEYLGRNDEQVKIRGYRVELGDIESTLGTHPHVAACAVQLRGGEPALMRLVAYVVLRGVPLDPTALREHLRRALPEYMVPTAFVTLDALPLTPNGKVDRKALSARGHETDASVRRPPAEPRSPLEVELVRLWEAALDVHPVGIDDDFFDLGGHSLLAAQLMRDIEAATGRSLPLAALFDGATVASVAARLLAVATPDAPSRTVVVRQGGNRRPLFFFHGDVYGGGLYCEGVARRLHAEQPLYVLPPHGPDGPATAEAMAADRVHTIRRIQANGPYRLGGFCSGGLVAFETARLLRQAGEEVELLILVDASAGNARFRWLAPVIRLASRLAATSEDARLNRQRAWVSRTRRAIRLASRPAGDIPGVLMRGARRVLRRILRRQPLVYVSAAGGPPDYVDAAALDFARRAATIYFPRSYDGPLCSLWAIGDSPPPADPSRGWRRVTSRVEAHVVPVSHRAVVVTHLPEFIRSALARLDGDA